MPKHKKDKHAQSQQTPVPPDKTARPTGDAPETVASQGDTRNAQQHDAANRLGSYEGKGNHARTGNRGHQ